MAAIPALPFVGTYRRPTGVSLGRMSRCRAITTIPVIQPMFDVDNDRAELHRGARGRGEFMFEGGSAAFARRYRFKTVLTPINDADAPPAGTSGADGIGNGLYSIHIRMLDGIDAGNTGVMLLHDGRIRGGDAFFDYIGAYTGGERQVEGRAGQPRAYAEPRATGRCSAAMRSASAFPARTTPTARKAKPPRSPASAASASRRCCESWWRLRTKPSRSPAAARR